MADTTVASCDVCIVGAGMAGLNALAVVSQYLERDQKIVLVERRPRVGGMWVDTYPYVRLHQPHRLFTAGDISWTLDRDAAYLATKDEVLDHVEHCVDVVRQRVKVEQLLGWEYQDHEAGGGIVRISCASPDGGVRVIEAKRLVLAFGFAVLPNEPLAVSSARVRSVSPDSCDVRVGEIRASDTPVWIIGGGKTAMDTAHAIITAQPGREVNMVAGTGTFFANRDRIFPSGSRRWWAGTRPNRAFLDVARQFDGTNERDVVREFRQLYGTWITPVAENFFLANLSVSERDTIAAGLNEVVLDHFDDVVDRDGSSDLVLRSGGARRIEPGSWVVNCSGYLLRNPQPYRPYVSDGGQVATVTTRSLTVLNSLYSGYFLSHALMAGRLGEMPLYELDSDDLRMKSKDAFVCAMATVSMHNLGVMLDHLPAKVFTSNHIDLDCWYPAHRQLFGALQFMRTHRREREHFRRSLDTVRERFGVRCGPLGA